MPVWVFLRHGESVANASRVLSGWNDVALTVRGVQQARRAGRLLAESLPQGPPDGRIVSSDLQRARETAQLALASWAEAAALPLPLPPIQEDVRLRERCMGVLQGESVDATRADGRMRLLLGWESRPQDGESLRQVAGRVLAAMVALDDGRGGLVVAHGGVLRILTGVIEGLTTEQISARRIDNARPLLREVERGTWEKMVVRYGVGLSSEG